MLMYSCIQLKSDVTRRRIHYQKLPELPTVTGLDAFVGPYSFTVKWKSTKQHTQNEMEASLSLCKHSTQMEGGGIVGGEKRDTR